MTPFEEVRSAALGHAIALVGPMTSGDDGQAAGRLVLSLATVFHAYIVEDAVEARRVLGDRPDPAEVIKLVLQTPKAADPENPKAPEIGG